MVGRSASGCWINPVESQFAQIQLVNIDIDDTYRIGFSNIIVEQLREQCALGSVFALNESLHLTPPVHAYSMDMMVPKKFTFLHSLGQVRASNELRKAGVFVSPSGVRSIWLRHSLESFKKRLSALERHVAETGVVLTEAQVIALERKQDDDAAHGEIETAHPGYLGSQDTFYVGTLKGVGRIYQQTFVDTYSKWATAKLYTTKTPITAADLLNDRVLPFFADQEMAVLRILTDRGTEYCGRAETHDYELYLAINDIEHTKTKAQHPQTNGICERFHKTILQEFYQVTFRRKIYETLDALQTDLDLWLRYYNVERTHQGKMCCGRTPLQTMIDGKEVWTQKVDNLNLN